LCDDQRKVRDQQADDEMIVESFENESDTKANEVIEIQKKAEQ
jgi:hypothetical protein